MDQTGHTTIAEWDLADQETIAHAVEAFEAELARGYYAVVSRGEGRAEQVRELPLQEPMVILRQPIVGG
jgi:hypothetical protein